MKPKTKKPAAERGKKTECGSRGRVTSIRLDAETDRQIGELSKKWDQNPSAVIVRAVQQAHERDCGKPPEPSSEK